MRIHRESDRLADVKAADIGLYHGSLHLHSGEILRDGEQRRSLQAGGDGLAGAHSAVDHGPCDRRADVSASEIYLRLTQHGLLLLHLRQNVEELRFGHLQSCLGPADGSGLREFLGARGH